VYSSQEFQTLRVADLAFSPFGMKHRKRIGTWNVKEIVRVVPFSVTRDTHCHKQLMQLFEQAHYSWLSNERAAQKNNLFLGITL
jgi:hypothetical protein